MSANACECGTIAEATERAEALFVEIAGADCAVWALQIAIALRSIALDTLERESPLTRSQLEEVANKIVREARKTRKPTDEMVRLYRERRRHLHG